ncbi:MAG: hypothetical protein ACYCZL_07550 [Polaromonas sp.]
MADLADFTDFGAAWLTGVCRALVLMDMADFPGFSTLTLWWVGLTAGLAPAFATALETGLAFSVTAALAGAAGRFTGFLSLLDVMGLAVGMGSPDVGNCFKY